MTSGRQAKRQRSSARVKHQLSYVAGLNRHLNVREAELESAACWLLHEGGRSRGAELTARAIAVTDSVVSRWNLSDDESFWVLEIVSAALICDAYWASQLPDEHVTDESLNARLRDVERALRDRHRVGVR